jgi:hypothetical protein
MSKYVKLKQILETLNDFTNLINNKHIAQIGHCNFGINYVNIQGQLEILNLNFKICKLRTHI